MNYKKTLIVILIISCSLLFFQTVKREIQSYLDRTVKVSFGSRNLINQGPFTIGTDSSWYIFALKDQNFSIFEKPGPHETDMYDPMVLSFKKENKVCQEVSILAEVCSVSDNLNYSCNIEKLDYDLESGTLLNRVIQLSLKPKSSYSMPIELNGQKYFAVEATMKDEGFPRFYPINKFTDLNHNYKLDSIVPVTPIKVPLFDINALNFGEDIILTGTDVKNKMRAFKVLPTNSSEVGFLVKEIPFNSLTSGDFMVRRNAGFIHPNNISKYAQQNNNEVISPIMMNFYNGRYIYGRAIGLAAFSFANEILTARLIENNLLEKNMQSVNASKYHHIYHANTCSDWLIGDLAFDKYYRIHGDEFNLNNLQNKGF